MTSLLLTGVGCGLATTVTAGLLLPVLRHRLDVPNHRSSHTVPTPRGGGLALVVGTVVTAVLVALTGDAWPADTWVLLGASLVLALVGLLDDVRGLPPVPRLLAQVVVGAAAGFVVGGALGLVVGALVVPAAVNMVNFMDGINGICAAHAVVGGVGALLAGQALGSAPLSVLGALTSGAALGFLPWNAPRARMFLGDVGSYLLGGLAGLSVTAGLSAGADAWRPEVIGCLAAPYLLFAADTATTLVRRRRRGEPLLEAHREHAYQRLVHGHGLPHWVVSFAMAAAAAVVVGAFLGGWLPGLVASAVAVVGFLVVAPRVVPRAVAS
ncbi:MraY family glycosyltransferase [Phycicoccus avicenniae]|uniref:MraY family glycosyltransferase n=1 Tax=Phycicoccus avicenniae TaxID=2828860 RepID=UPI003D2CA3B3